MYRTWSSRFVARVLTGVCLASAAAGQGAVDGSFESGGTGWTLQNASIVNAGTGAYHGTKVLEIDPKSDPGQRFGTATATFATIPGQEYRVTFAYQPGFATGSPQLSLLVGGTGASSVAGTVYLFDPGVTRSNPERTAWLQRSVAFFADAATTTIQLGPLSRWNPDLGWGRLWLDDVRFEQLARQKTLGRDAAVRVTLPSSAAVGEAVDLTVAMNGHLRTQDSGGVFDTRPMRFTGTLDLSSDDPLATHPAQVVFAGDTHKVVRVQLGTPGIRRFKVKNGSTEVLSNPVFVSTEPLANKPYWGDLHVHTDLGHSGWAGGTGVQNYLFASGFADLDFAALTEHYGWSVVTGWMDRLVPATQAFDLPGQFVALIAVETSQAQGHVNYYLRGSDPFEMFDGRNAFANREAVLSNLRSRGVRALAIPHHFSLLDPVDWRETDSGTLRLAEIYSNHGSSEEAGNWWRFPDHTGNYYGDTRGTKGHDFRAALERGQRLGVVGSSDSHTLQPGLAGLTCVLAPALTREGIWDALYLRDCYATSGERILLDLSIGGARMGETVFRPSGTPLSARVEVHGTDLVTAIELVRDGQVVASLAPNALDATVDFPLAGVTGAKSAVYARVRQRNLHRAWSSPIWIEPAGKPDFLLEPRHLRFDHSTGTLGVVASNIGSLDANAVLRVFSSATQPAFSAEEATSSLTQPAVLVRVEPVNAGQARLKVVLFTPRTFVRTFYFSGELRLWNARGQRVVADPRRMLTVNGSTLSWNELCGYHYRSFESKAGQITDFELLVDTQGTTTVDLVARIDGSPVSEVRVGGVVHAAPLVVSVPLGQIALTPPLFERSVSLGARKRGVTVQLPGLPPGTTYVAVLDPEGLVQESAEDNNASALSVPAQPLAYQHWPGYLPMMAAPMMAESPGDPDPCCSPTPPMLTRDLPPGLDSDE